MSAILLPACLILHKSLGSLKTLLLRLVVELVCSEAHILSVSTLLWPHDQAIALPSLLTPFQCSHNGDRDL